MGETDFKYDVFITERDIVSTKAFFIALLCILLITSSCAPSQKISPTDVLSLTPSQTATPTLTATPEPSSTPTQTAEQRMNQLAAQAISLGWDPNDETTWKIAAGTENAGDLQKLIDIDADPNVHFAAQLERDTFLADMWRIQLEQSILDDSTRAPAVEVMGHYFVSAFAPEIHAREELHAMKPEELQGLVHNLSAEEMENLEMYRCAYNHEAMKPLFAGLRADIDVMNKEVGTRDNQANPNIYFRPTYKDAQLIGGLYGLWNNTSGSKYSNPNLDFSYNISVLGKKMKWNGTLGGESAWMDYGVTLRLPYNRTGIRGILLDSAVHPVRFNFIVVTDSDEPITFSAGDYQHGWADGSYKPEDLTVTLHTRENTGSDNYPTFAWLTKERLLGLNRLR